jgi:hypothetical protein
MRGTIHAVLISSLTAWCILGLLVWITRDGLGPDAVESQGWESLTRLFWNFYWGPIFVLLAAAAMLWGKYVFSARKHDAHDPEAP